ncbi:unnamed protein product [Aureobasidium uvarum]|uniref:A-kinase anchor protein 7-like phosphoesterase domain-containing protein n=1 Tax=Aureobasidium uvarum TaxID=2773716 RepID=A0A9N8KGA4_9PEZI|nr:unnamed protein product [Aureobasidium uvarum]
MTRHAKNRKNISKKPSLTHFLCIPLVNSLSQPQLEASIGKFKEHVCSTGPVEAGEGPSPMIPAKAIRPLGSLHLTLGVMSLDEEKLAQATTLLQSLHLNKLLHEASTCTEPHSITNATQAPDHAPSNSSDTNQNVLPDLLNNPLTISLESLEPMQSPSKTSILYIRPEDPTNRLQILCQALRKKLTDAGLLVPDIRPLRLHATLVNTIYVKGRKKSKKQKSEVIKPEQDENNATEPVDQPPSMQIAEEEDNKTEDPEKKESENTLQANQASSGHGPSAKSSLYIDATSLISTYASHIWASGVPITKIAICEMGVKKQLSSTGEVIGEAYKEVAVREISEA